MSQFRCGGINTDSSQIGDGRSSPDNRKCRRCDNVVAGARDLICGDCRVASFDRAQAKANERNRIRAAALRQPRYDLMHERLSAQLSGLQADWFSFGMDGGAA